VDAIFIFRTQYSKSNVTEVAKLCSYIKNKYMQMSRNKFLNFLLYLLILQLIITGCKSRKVKDETYLQNAYDTTIAKAKYQEYKFKIDDILAIQVIAGSQKQEDASLYNLPTAGNSRSGVASTYQIDSLGFITFPRVGRIKVVSLTKDEVASSITKLLIDEVKNPLVIVRLDRFKVNVLGEVKKPGVLLMQSDKVNIIDVITEVGDIADYGKKNDIMVLRKSEGKYETYRVDLTNVAFINSPAFQIFPDDIIYVGPSEKKAKFSQERTNFLRDFSIVMSAVSTLFFILSSIGVIKR